MMTSEDTGFDQKVRDQLPFVVAVSNLIVEAERLNTYGNARDFIRLTQNIYRKIASEEILQKEAKQASSNYQTNLVKRFIEINRRYLDQDKDTYQRLKARKAKRNAQESECTKFIFSLQNILSKHGMLVKSSGGEEGSI